VSSGPCFHPHYANVKKKKREHYGRIFLSTGDGFSVFILVAAIEISGEKIRLSLNNGNEHSYASWLSKPSDITSHSEEEESANIF
jgi:hypothetical protein